MTSRVRWMCAITALGALMTACGGDGDSGNQPPAPPPTAPPVEPPPPAACLPIIDNSGVAIGCSDILWASAGGGEGDGTSGGDGTAGDGAPIVGGTVTLFDLAGKNVSAVTDNQGYYRVNLTGLTPPFVLHVADASGRIRFRSFSTQPLKSRGFIVMNITGLTDKLASDVAVAAGKSGASEITPAIVAANGAAVAEARARLVQTLRPQIEAAGLNIATFDPITHFFRPNLTGHDLVLETTAVFIDSTGATQVVGKPLSACTAPSNWFVGVDTCTPSSNPGFILAGATLRLVDNTGSRVGAAEFSCTNGVLSSIGTPQCAAPPVARDCGAPSTSWTVGVGTCTADTPPTAVADGQTVTLTDASAPLTGSTSYRCADGTLSTVGATTCAGPVGAANCAAPASSWSVAGNLCRSDLPLPETVASGGSLQLTDATGSARGGIAYLCTEGALTVSGTPTCATPVLRCGAPSANWSSGTAACTSDTAPPGLDSGQTVTLTDSASPTTGSVSWACTNGNLSQVSPAVCTEPAPTLNCNLGSSSWTVGRNVCSADNAPTQVAADSSVTLEDNTSPLVGSVTYACSNGSLSQVGPAACAASTASSCDTGPLLGERWSVGNETCTADSVPGTVASGTSFVLTDARGAARGTRTYECVDGTLRSVGTPSCAVPPVDCQSTVNSWSEDGVTCMADNPGTRTIPAGGSVTWTSQSFPTFGELTQQCINGRVVESSRSCFVSSDTTATGRPRGARAGQQ